MCIAMGVGVGWGGEKKKKETKRTTEGMRKKMGGRHSSCHRGDTPVSVSIFILH